MRAPRALEHPFAAFRDRPACATERPIPAAARGWDWGSPFPDRVRPYGRSLRIRGMRRSGCWRENSAGVGSRIGGGAASTIKAAIEVERRGGSSCAIFRASFMIPRASAAEIEGLVDRLAHTFFQPSGADTATRSITTIKGILWHSRDGLQRRFSPLPANRSANPRSRRFLADEKGDGSRSRSDMRRPLSAIREPRSKGARKM